MINNCAVVFLIRNDAFWSPYALESIRGHFPRVILYDTFSSDGSRDVLEHFANEYKKDGTEVVLEYFPDMDKRSQLLLRNSMFAEAQRPYVYMLDADEVLSKESLLALENEFPRFVAADKIYGIVNRTEICSDLQSAYSPNVYTNHHRVYSVGRCIARGSHPGEFYEPAQKSSNEYKFSEDVTVYHMHNTVRSPLMTENSTPGRIERKSKATYTPGSIEPIDLFEKLPILKKPIENFIVNPVLAALQRKL